MLLIRFTPFWVMAKIEEGQVWEAAMFANQYHLDNLVAIVDNNGLQIDGKLSEVCSPEPIPEKFEAFGWHVIRMDAHDFDAIDAAMHICRNRCCFGEGRNFSA